MSLVTDSDILAYIQINDKCLTPSMRALLTQVRIKAENLVKQHVGYNIEQATYTEYLPAKTLSVRAEGDFTSTGFDMIGGTVVPRQTFPNVRREMVLSQIPVRSIASIYDNAAAWNVDGGDWPATSLLPTNAYFLDRDYEDEPAWSGIVYRNTGSWSVSTRTIRVTYTAGLIAAELASQYTEFGHAVQVTAAKMLADIAARSNMARTGTGPIGSVTIEDFSVSYAGGNAGMIGAFLGTGIGSAALPTEAAQILTYRVHPAKYF